MSNDKSINPADLPQSEAFKNKDINQHKHLADMGKPVDKTDKLTEDLEGKTNDRTSKEDGINQENLSGGATQQPENQSDI